LNDPTTVKGQLDEGGRPWGNIPHGIMLDFDNSVLDSKREDIVHQELFRNDDTDRPELAKIRVLPPLQHPPIGIGKKVDIEQEKLHTLRSTHIAVGRIQSNRLAHLLAMDTERDGRTGRQS